MNPGHSGISGPESSILQCGAQLAHGRGRKQRYFLRCQQCSDDVRTQLGLPANIEGFKKKLKRLGVCMGSPTTSCKAPILIQLIKKGRESADILLLNPFADFVENSSQTNKYPDPKSLIPYTEALRATRAPPLKHRSSSPSSPGFLEQSQCSYQGLGFRVLRC